MAVFVQILCKKWLVSVHVFSRIHWTSQFKQGSRISRPCLTGHPVPVGVFVWGRPPAGPPPSSGPPGSRSPADRTPRPTQGIATGQYSLYTLMKYCKLRQLQRLPGLSWIVRILWKKGKKQKQKSTGMLADQLKTTLAGQLFYLVSYWHL